MSEPIPESIPTSADPRTKRPLKKRHINAPPSAVAASQIDALFSKPDQYIRISSSNKSSVAARTGHAPPDAVQNVQGSSAGAGSGEFHIYKASRRREYERLRMMEEQLEEEVDKENFEKERCEKNKEDEEKTRKKREKRAKKMKRKGGRKGDGEANECGDETSRKQKGNGRVLERKGDVEANGRLDVNGDQEDSAEQVGGATATALEPIGLIIHDDG